ncbi:MAG: protein O-mannosyl-transferase [Thermoanaerobaculia bacterium]|nr:protein O-mannosyl-transferase [Thermoanaerobaculia bacterium]
MGRKAREKQIRSAGPRSEAAAEAAMPAPRWGGREWTIVALLLVLTIAVFGQVASHSFINFDDGQFIYENAHVLNGDVTWALTSAEIGWYPLTWLSHMLDVAIWGQRAGMHLLTGVFLHALSTVLLFLAMRRLTRAPWPSAFIAALFAIHPMHVESVAWASERKDTLSTLFAMLAFWLYARAPRKMLGVSIALALSLMAKQMYITLPFVFLLLDVWPLERLRTLDDLRKRAIEKWPLFLLTIAGAFAAFLGQRSLDAVQSTTSLPMASRIANALIAYARYVGKLFVPTNIGLPYPLTAASLGDAIIPLLVIAAITIAVLLARRAMPWLAVGWLWFLGTLIPVIGIIAIGSESHPDRYTYFSYIGLFIAITFSARKLRIPNKALAAIGAVAVACYAVVAMQQLRYWKDSETHFTHTLAITQDNSVAEYLLGQAQQATKPDQAIPHLRRAIALTESLLRIEGAKTPDWYPQAYVGIGTAMLTKARAMPQSPAREALIREAIIANRRALTINPNAAHAKNNIGVAMQMLPRTPLQADYDAYLNEGTGLSQAGRYEEAVIEFRHAVEIFPQSIEAHIYLGLGLLQANKRPEGVAELRAAKALSPTDANEFLTNALHLPPNDANLDGFIAQASQ